MAVAFVNMVVMNAMPEAVTLEEMVSETLKDQEMENLKSHIQGDGKVKIPVEFANVADELSCPENGLILRNTLIIVPKKLRSRIVALAHAGHQGVVKTKSLMRSKIWFPGIDKMVERAVASCYECQVGDTKRTYEALRPSEMPRKPWTEVSGDFYGPFKDGSYWYVNHCDSTRFFDVTEILGLTAGRVIKVLEELFTLLGIPILYKTDNGPPFNSREFAEFAKALGFTHRITPYWPRANGEVERCMRNLKKVVRNARLAGIPKEKELLKFLRAQRDTPHCTTGISPAMRMFNRSNTSGIPAIETNVDPKLLEEKAMDNDAKAKAKMKKHFDEVMKTKVPHLKVGMKVLVKQEQKVKSDSFWDPKPLVITEVNRSMITAERTDKRVTRNSSFFKQFIDYFDDENPVGNGIGGATSGKVDNNVRVTTTSHDVPNPKQVVAGEEPCRRDQALVQKGGSEEMVQNDTSEDRGEQGSKLKPGRPTKEVAEQRSKLKEGEKLKELEQRRQNPNIRTSTRIQHQQSKKDGGGCDVVASRD